MEILIDKCMTVRLYSFDRQLSTLAFSLELNSCDITKNFSIHYCAHKPPAADLGLFFWTVHIYTFTL